MEINKDQKNEQSELLIYVKKKANEWITGNYDEETRKQVKYLLENDTKELIESFHTILEFGTGGLRGIMGVGPNRMNKYTVGMTAQGVANYLKKTYSVETQTKAAIAYDSRNNSKYFAQITADVLSANNIQVYLFDELRPLPELSFTVRYLNCQCGIVITSSHNPKEYNGIKVFWDDGGQIVSPHDKNIIQEVQNIKNIDEVRFNANKQLIKIIGKEIDEVYLKQIKSLSLSPQLIQKHKDLKIVYTPIHGSGVRLVPQILANFGFTNVYHVPEQDIPDGNFPTVRLPNPEETDALNKAIQKAKEVDANLVMATDPDADRLAVAVRNRKNEFVVLTGNQTASLLIYYLITQWKERGKLTGKEFIVKTIVTSELLREISERNNVECIDVLTGFKWIADVIKKNEGKKTFICGGEESIGFLISDFVRDKDAVITSAFMAETAAWAAERGKSLYDLLIDIYYEYGFYKAHLVYIVKSGIVGADEIQELMKNYRNNPPSTINKSNIIKIKDYQLLQEKDLINNIAKPLHLPKSNVIQFYLEDESKITARPSGTEPKIKYYFEVKEQLKNKDNFEKLDELLRKRIQDIITSMNLQ
jgi:phosphoglucomutase